MKKVLLVAALLLCALNAFADEGMWMIQTIDRALEKRMRAAGLKLDGKIEASPAVYKDTLVIGTCSRDGAFMYGIKIE